MSAYCHYCGTQIDEDDIDYCGQCGPRGDGMIAALREENARLRGVVEKKARIRDQATFELQEACIEIREEKIARLRSALEPFSLMREDSISYDIGHGDPDMTIQDYHIVQAREALALTDPTHGPIALSSARPVHSQSEARRLAIQRGAPAPVQEQSCGSIRTVTLQDNGIIRAEDGRYLGRMEYTGSSACDALLARKPAEEPCPACNGSGVIHESHGSPYGSETLNCPACAEERGPEVGDIVAWRRIDDGQLSVTGCYAKEQEPIHPRKWRRIILMRRAEVEARVSSDSISARLEQEG